MGKRKVSLELLKSIAAFINEVNKYYSIDAVYLFGSYANGTNHEWSDVDLAIVSKDIKDRLKDRAKLFAIASDFDILIEPHPYNTNDFNADEYMLVDEILRTGIKVA